MNLHTPVTTRHLQPVLLALIFASSLLLTAFGNDDSFAIARATKKFVHRESPGIRASVRVEKVSGDFARVAVTAPGTDNALAFLQHKEAGWEVLDVRYGFDPETYKSMGIPRKLRK